MLIAAEFAVQSGLSYSLFVAAEREQINIQKYIALCILPRIGYVYENHANFTNIKFTTLTSTIRVTHKVLFVYIQLCCKTNKIHCPFDKRAVY